MKQLHVLALGSTLAALLGTTAARADVTADQIWQGWVDYYSAMGQEVTTGSKEMQGDTLVVTDAVFASKANPEATFSSTVAEIRLKELGDGRVEITLADSIPMLISGKPKDGKPFEAKIDLTQSGLSLIASGTPDDTTYDFTAPEMAVKADGINVDGENAPVVVDVKLTSSVGKTHMTRTGGIGVESAFTAETMDMAVKAAAPDSAAAADKGSFDMTGSFQKLTGNSKAMIVDGADMATNLAAALNAGTTIAGDFSYGSGTYNTNFSSPEGDGTMAYTGDGGKVRFAMDKGGVAYGAEGGAAQMTMTLPTLPVPVDIGIGSTAFDMRMPVSKGDSPQPFKVLMKLVDLKVSDGIWDMFDAGKKLPRDPATIVIDATGNATMKADILDPANAQSTAAPGEVNDFALNEIRLSAVGAELSGNGSATIDNSSMPPKPVGAVDLKLVGGNALIDKIVAMGFLPEEQAAGFRMMLGLFTVPAGEDTLTSKIEFKDDGGIYANGQRLQ